ncbi:ABC transporter ATP-binding protein [Roseateles sp. So40a]|uniref:ABC transporter ATP-binding protein n=1 Tax=Roseateles sp. So40a TaxID=3400226 RepID=UPI003A877749
MARIDLDLAHAYRPDPKDDNDYALLPLTMTFEDGGAYALLGPSGCGKTTMLNIVSGLLKPSHGTVKFDGRDVTALTPQQRNIAQVFQFPVIYDTMTVAENLAFPLRNRGVPADRIKARVGKIAEMLELNGQLNQRASGLSADAKQKISLGRGLVREDVSAVLFDEPLTVIDPHLKWQLRRKLKQIHNELKLTLIYVTHDQVEALTFADRIVVMTRGRAVQVGTAGELFERPSHRFVGHFIGSPGMNFLPAALEDGGGLSVAGQPVAGRVDPASGAALSRAEPFMLGIRPEYVDVDDVGDGVPALPGTVTGVVSQVQDIGTYWLLTARIGPYTIKARLHANARPPAAGATVALRVMSAHTCFYGADERLIAAAAPTMADAALGAPEGRA